MSVHVNVGAVELCHFMLMIVQYSCVSSCKCQCCKAVSLHVNVSAVELCQFVQG